MYGTLRIDELIMPIVDFQLTDGDIKLIAVAEGPCGSHQGHVRIFGKDGLPITDHALGEPVTETIPALQVDQSATVVYTLHVKRFAENERSRPRWRR